MRQTRCAVSLTAGQRLDLYGALSKLADDVHFTRFAVETQGQFFLAVDQYQRVGAQAFDLFRAEVEAVAQAVFGDHQRDFAAFLLAFEGRCDDAYAVFFIESAGLAVENVAEVVERLLRIRGRRFERRSAFRAAVGGAAGDVERFDGCPTQTVERRRGQEARAVSGDLDRFGAVDRGAELAEAFAQGVFRAFGVAGAVFGLFDLGAGEDAFFIARFERVTAFGFGEAQTDRDAPLGRRFLQLPFELLVAVAVERGADSQVFGQASAAQRRVEAVAPGLFFGAIDAQPDELGVRVVVGDAVAVVERCKGRNVGKIAPKA